MRTLQIKIPDSQYSKISDFLKSFPAVEVSEENERGIVPSSAAGGEKPSNHQGPWKGDERDFQEIRRKAWTRKR